MKRINQLLKLSKYPKWSSKFITKSIFIFLLGFSFIYIVYDFVIIDLNYKYQVMPNNVVIEYDYQSFDINEFNNFNETKSLKAQTLSDRLETEVDYSFVVSSTIHAKTKEVEPVRGYSVHFTNDIEIYTNHHYKQAININYLDDEHYGIVISKSLYEKLSIDGNNLEFLVTTNNYDNQFENIKIAGFYETAAYKSKLFDSLEDDASDLEYTCFAPLEVMFDLNQSLGIYSEISVETIYEATRPIRVSDIAFIDAISYDAEYKLMYTEGVINTVSPLLKLIMNVMISFIVMIGLVIVMILAIRYEDLNKANYIQYIFFRSKNNIIIDNVLANLILITKSFLYYFILLLIIIFSIKMYSNYWINIAPIIVVSITTLLLIVLLPTIYFIFRFPKKRVN